MRNLKTVGAIAAGALAATALTGVAVATTAIADDESTTQSSPDATGSDTEATDHPEGHSEGRRGPGGPHGGRGMERGVLHGELVVETPDGEYVTQQVQRGEVTAISSTSITVASEDGFTATYAIDADTDQKRDREDGAAQIGDTAHVVATVDGTTTTAKRVMAMSPEAVAEMEAQREAMEQWLSERPEGGDRDAMKEWMSERPEGAKGPEGMRGGMRGPGGMRGERPQAPADATSFGA